MRILTIDPGGQTGFALFADRLIETGNFKTWSMLDCLINVSTQVIVEKPFMSPSVNPVVFEVYGATCERTYHNSSLKLIEQQAYIPNFVTKRYADYMHLLKGTQHQKDALMHLIFYLTRPQQGFSIEDVLKAYEDGSKE